VEAAAELGRVVAQATHAGQHLVAIGFGPTRVPLAHRRIKYQTPRPYNARSTSMTRRIAQRTGVTLTGAHISFLACSPSVRSWKDRSRGGSIRPLMKAT